MVGERYAASLRGWRVADDPALAESDGGTAIALELDGARAELGIAADGSVRLRFGAEASPAPVERSIERGPWIPNFVDLRESPDGGFVLGSPRLPVRVEVLAKPFSLRVLDRRDGVIAELRELACEEHGGTRLSITLPRDASIHGLGGAPGSLDRRGEVVRLRNRAPSRGADGSESVSIPFVLLHRRDPRGPGACGVLFENFGPVSADVGATDPDALQLSAEYGGADVMLLPGPRPSDVLERLTARCGRTPLPPLWALGHHRTHSGRSSTRALLRFAHRLREEALPGDAIHLDVAALAWPTRRFPDPAALTAELAALGLRVVTRFEPALAVDPEDAVYRSGLEENVFVQRASGDQFTLRAGRGRSALPDFNRREVRQWWGRRHAELLATGVAGIANDGNQPAGSSLGLRVGRAELTLRGQRTVSAQQSDPAEPGRVVPHETVRNLYGHQQCRATRAALVEGRPEERPFVETRAGYAGVQRYAAVVGEIPSSWAGLRDSIPRLLNLSLSGVAFCGTEIGGSSSACPPELYLRWLQLGALLPLARSGDVGANGRMQRRYGRRAAAIARDALGLRMRLLPYLEGLFRVAEARGTPVWRPLLHEFPEDRASLAVADQLMLGPALLVAPVLERGARERTLYLPPGTWIDWHGDAILRGGRSITVPAPLERLPLFVRAGSVLPTRSPVEHVGQAPEEPCVLEVFPGGDLSTEWIEDDGLSTAYRAGVSACTPLRLWSQAAGRLRIELGRREGPFTLPPRPLRFAVHACPPPRSVLLDGTRLQERDDAPGYRVTDSGVDVFLVDVGCGAAVEVEPEA